MNELMNINESKSYCSITAETADAKKAIYNATTAPKYRLRDFINKNINIANIYIEPVKITNESTGEISEAPRTVIIDNNGESYVCVSSGIFNAIVRIIQIFGDPESWDKPLSVVVKQISRGTNQIMTLEVI